MDILNYFSWIKRKDYRAALPTDTVNVLPVGAKDSSRDDQYRPIAVSALPLQSLYDKGAVTQITSISTAVTADFRNGVITTVSSTLAAGASTKFTVNNEFVKTTSTVLISLTYANKGGIPYVYVEAVNNGSFEVRISNLHASAALGDVLNINFLVIE